MFQHALITVASLAAVASLASAQLVKIHGLGDGGAVPDNDPLGLRTEFFVGTHATLFDLNLAVTGLTSTWVGDVIITLEHKDTGTSVTVLDRVGFPVLPSGDSSDFGHSYVWDDESTGDLEAAAAALGATGVLADFSYVPENALAAFDGEDKFGTWSLEVSDNAPGNDTAYADWFLEITIPAPGAAMLFGLAGLATARRRR